MRLLLQPQVSEVYANLGWTGMMLMKYTPNWDEDGWGWG